MRLRVMRILSRMNVGGPSVQAAVLYRGLDPDRFEQHLYVGDVAAGETEHLTLRAKDVVVHRVPGLGRTVRPGDDARAFASLLTEMRKLRPHIVHTHAAKAGALGRVAACAAGVPIRVHTFHGHLLNGYFGPLTTRAVAGAESLLARKTHRIISVGAQVRDELLAAGIGKQGQYRVVAPGVDLPALPGKQQAKALLGVPGEAPVIAYVGRVTAIKRPDRLKAAFDLVRQEMPKARLLICGDGELTETLRGKGIHHLGWRADVETVYAAADLVVLTSDNEGMPVSLIEAGMAGVPAVATRVGSVAEVVQHGQTGMLCDRDPHAIAATIVSLLGQPQLRAHMGQAAAEWVPEKFGGSRLTSDIDRVYTELARERGLWRPAQRLATDEQLELIA